MGAMKNIETNYIWNLPQESHASTADKDRKQVTVVQGRIWQMT